MKNKKEKIILTGASSGFGKAITEYFLEHGAEVLAVARNIDKIENNHPKLKKFACDISTAEGVDKLFAEASANFGEPDMFFANAGFGYHEKLEQADWEHIEEIYKTNVFSPVYALEKMIELKGDKPFNFVITASGVAYAPVPGMALYNSTKAAVHNFAAGIRFELNSNQILQTVYPVAMKTPFFKNDGEPLPSMQQDLQKAAKYTAKAVLKDKERIYPSGAFRASMGMIIALENLTKAVLKNDYKKFQRWWNNR
jgi:short-subunit dehydrogenase